MAQKSFEDGVAADHLMDRQRKKNRLATRVIGLVLLVAGLGYLGHWYFHLEGGLLIAPKSARLCVISEIEKGGACRFKARTERTFSLKAMALQEEAYRATDATGKVKVDFPHKVDFQDAEVWIVGRANREDNAVTAIWMGDKFSWNVAAEIAVPIILVALGACFLGISFSSDHDEYLKHIASRLERKKANEKSS